MKKFLRYIQTDSEASQIRLRQDLNDMGFYVLSRPGNALEVNVIEEDYNIGDKVFRALGALYAQVIR